MANAKKKLQKSAQKFRRIEPYLHTIISRAIDHMARTIKKLGASEVVVEVRNGAIIDEYANDKH